MSTTDPVLRALVFAVSMAKERMGVALAVNGTIITGQLVSPEEYAAAVIEQIRRSHAKEAPAGSGPEGFFARIAESAKESRERHRAAALAGDFDSGSEQDLPDYLHLVDAFAGDRPAGGAGAAWRIRLRDVSGWSLVPAAAPEVWTV
ncbi:hypothetical protein [Microbispora sp. H11081]|uniref:hypothetical protein n=1 Tax=Microbispora sp. H11081 TaxID=2729107 RepID=UPI0014744A4C|nr:hypothetical protein [Microbispora sp. H11081]